MSDVQTENRDLKFTSGSLTLVADGEEIRQRLEQRLRLFLGEWFLDVTIGVPYLQKILGQKNPVREEVEAFIVEAILGTPGVNKLLELSTDIGVDRRLTLTFRALADSGALNLEIEL